MSNRLSKYVFLIGLVGISTPTVCCSLHPQGQFPRSIPMNCKHKECPLLSATLVPLTRGKYAIVDTEDYTEVSKHKWCVCKPTRLHFRAARREKKKFLYMHREIMHSVKGDKVDIDHRNHNTLDNRKCNLRKSTRQQNLSNMQKCRGSSRYKGVCWFKNRRRWMAYITKNYKRKTIGYFDNEEDAAKAYDRKAKELFGEYAHLNKI